jgi:hypothetical protein
VAAASVGCFGAWGSTEPASYESFKTDQVNKLKTWILKQAFFIQDIDAMNIDVSKDLFICSCNSNGINIGSMICLYSIA